MADWQDISTAPRDGTFVLLYDDRFKHSEASYLIAHWHTPLEEWAGRPNSKGRFPLWGEATHWMPLPVPPEPQP